MAEAAMFLGTVVTLLVLRDPVPPARDLLIGGAAGAAGVVGVLALYYALANGAMTVVAPLTAIVAAVLPVTVGLVSGERPGAVALAGVALALVAVAMIGGAIGRPAQPTPARLIAMAVVSGLGFGALFVLFDSASDDSGAWPLFMSRFVSVPILLLAALAARIRITDSMRRPLPLMAVGIGTFSLLANLAYVEATRLGALTIVAVVVSMYPASTVVLASVVDGERVSRAQGVGLGLAGVALVLVTAG
jgi:drug/metabolite transporter (DMT)-like permease